MVAMGTAAAREKTDNDDAYSAFRVGEMTPAAHSHHQTTTHEAIIVAPNHGRGLFFS